MRHISLYHAIKDEQRFWKRILIVDDEADVTITFKAGIEESYNNNGTDKRIEVYTSNNPVVAISEPCSLLVYLGSVEMMMP